MDRRVTANPADRLSVGPRGRGTDVKWLLGLILTLVFVACGSAQPQAGLGAQAGAPTTTSLSLGLNTAAWDGNYSGSSAVTVNGFLGQAGVGLLRYPGGSSADDYDWSDDRDVSGCPDPNQASSCAVSDVLNFDAFSRQAHQASASLFVTVNYGSGTSTEAADWVTHARQTRGAPVALWEVGNENYSCSEANRELAGPPADVSGYLPKGPVCPDTKTMANSYAVNALPFLRAMHRADPSADLGVPWAFEPAVAAGAGVTDASSWNDTVLRHDGAFVGFVDAHWYPFSATAGLSGRQLLESVKTIPAAMRTIRSTLRRYAPPAQVVIGETNISNQETTLDFEPVAALFAAANALEWLSQGATSVDWWDMNNYGSPAAGDYGMFSSGEPAPVDSPLPPYYGYLLASSLTKPGSRLRALRGLPKGVLGFAAQGNTSGADLFVNSNPSRAAMVRAGLARSGSQGLHIGTYSAATAKRTDPIIQTTASAATIRRGITLPAESIVLITTKDQ